MERRILKLMCMAALLMLCIASCNVGRSHGAKNEPMQVILDTDLGNDIDDALALQMLINYENAGKAEIKGITISKSNPLSLAYTKAYYKRYGHGAPAFGYAYGGPNPDEGNYLRAAYATMGYLDTVKVKEPEAYLTIRKLLADSRDAAVRIIAVGPLTNMARLLQSLPDSISPSTGMELVRRKVSRLDIMGGNFDTEGDAEWNLLQDTAAARKVLEEWPTPLVASGFEVGDKVRFPASVITTRFPEHHPLRVGYEKYMKMPYNRQCWDLIPVLLTMEPENPWVEESQAGTLLMDAKGRTRLTDRKGGNRRYVVLKTDSLADVLARRVTDM